MGYPWRDGDESTVEIPWDKLNELESYEVIDWHNVKIEEMPYTPYKPPRFRWLRRRVTSLRYWLACWISPYEMDE